jgi:hypothetical protein
MPARLRDASSATPARDACPAKGQPKRCTLALCRRRRACAHPSAPPAGLGQDPSAWTREQRQQAFATWVLNLHGWDDLPSAEADLRAQHLKSEHRRRKAARRADRAGRAEDAGAAAKRVTGDGAPSEASPRPLIRCLLADRPGRRRTLAAGR